MTATTTTITIDSPLPLQTLDHASYPQTWTPVLTSAFPYKSSSFLSALDQMFQHPEHNTSWILRSDTLSDSALSSLSVADSPDPRSISISGFGITRTLVRRFIPRNPQRDAPAEQTCHFLTDTSLSGEIRELVVFLNHHDTAALTPYYLPKVRGIGWFLCPSTSPPSSYTVSLLYSHFASAVEEPVTRLQRTAHHLLQRALKLASGIEAGYIKRVHHDLIIPRESFQDRYLSLRHKHASRLVSAWREKTDPRKHVFEDILIATFLLCLWDSMYPAHHGWVGFVDIGCGNGVLVDILLREGWSGKGFDARKRRSWDGFCDATREHLEELVLVPVLLAAENRDGWHDGVFEEGTFIVSNHADELTAWTPLLAAASACPFLAIPCCSHDLSGARKRFPPPRAEEGNPKTGDLRYNLNLSKSTYASLCAYVERLARECGWEVEREVLRIPSTRNVAIIGRRRTRDVDVDVAEIVRREGGGMGWIERVEGLQKDTSIAGH